MTSRPMHLLPRYMHSCECRRRAERNHCDWPHTQRHPCKPIAGPDTHQGVCPLVFCQQLAPTGHTVDKTAFVVIISTSVRGMLHTRATPACPPSLTAQLTTTVKFSQTTHSDRSVTEPDCREIYTGKRKRKKLHVLSKR